MSQRPSRPGIRKSQSATAVGVSASSSRASSALDATTTLYPRVSSHRRIKCLTIVDDFTRENLEIAVDHGISGSYVARVLEIICQFRGAPRAVRTDKEMPIDEAALLAELAEIHRKFADEEITFDEFEEAKEGLMQRLV